MFQTNNNINNCIYIYAAYTPYIFVYVLYLETN